MLKGSGFGVLYAMMEICEMFVNGNKPPPTAQLQDATAQALTCAS